MRVRPIFFAVLLIQSIAHASTPSISLSVSKSFFNPTLGEKVEITLRVPARGALTLQVIDRDGFIARTLLSAKQIEPESLSVEWSGRNDANEIVPDEAYSFRVELVSGKDRHIYFPANAAAEPIDAVTHYYDRKSGTLRYQLPKASRVHAQAGTAITDPVTKEIEGPVLKTIVNREPRSAGTVAEHWNGFTSEGDIYVPDLPNFAVAIAATTLPENSVITTGNRENTFLEAITKRRGNSLLTFKPKDHHHHQGLTSLQDTSPDLDLSSTNAKWSKQERLWTTSNKALTLSGSLKGLAASAFLDQPGKVLIFLDGKQIREIPAPEVSRFDLEIPLSTIRDGVHIVAVNWGSQYAPTAVGSFRFKKTTTALSVNK